MSDQLPDTPDDRPLDDRIHDFYDNQALPYDMLDELRETIGDLSQTRRMPTHLRQQRRPTFANVPAFAALVMLLFVATASTLFWQVRSTEQRQIAAVAAEIALNHAKQFDTEFATVSIPALANEMQLLDFAPVNPKRLQYGSYQLDGARYCTIDSAIAVQIHMRDDAQQDYTLYQFRDDETLALDGEQTIAVEDIQVTLWREGEVVMGLAERAENK